MKGGPFKDRLVLLKDRLVLLKDHLVKDRLVLIAFLLIFLVFGVLVARKYILSTPEPATQMSIPDQIQQEVKQLRDVTLYFGASDGGYLVAESREIEGCLTEADCLKATVQALVNGPIGDLKPILPSHTVVNGVAEDNGVATLDFSRVFASGHPGGSVPELLTVYGLANTLAENFPHVRQVRILLEGNPAETIKGHVDLRKPITADFRFSHPPEGPAAEDLPR